MSAAKDLGTFQWKGVKVDFFPDFTKDVQDKRNKFTEVRCLCMKRGLQYSMQYLAVFWVTVGETRHRFEDAAAARRCIDNHHPAEEAKQTGAQYGQDSVDSHHVVFRNL